MVKTRAFTLLEMAVTLGIVCALLLIGTLQLETYQADLIFDNTVKETMLALKQASRISTLKHAKVEVNYLPRAGKIVLLSRGFEREIEVDPSVQIKNLNEFSISKDGIISPRTITFLSQHKIKHVKVQMAWGKVINED